MGFKHKHELATKHKVTRNEVYDCYFCKICNIWLESKCTDLTCQFCSKRPDKPNL